MHPFWLVGFRPFFCIGMFIRIEPAGLWLCFFGGRCSAGEFVFDGSVARHEMFFASLGCPRRFPADLNQELVKIRGYHGYSLMFLVAAWLLERFGMWFEGVWPQLLFRISNNLFLGLIVAMLLWT